MTKLAEFIKEHAVEINENNFTEVYEDAGIPSLTRELTEIFLAAGIAPLAYMRAVPNYYLYESKVASVVIPNTVKGIGDSAFEGCTGLTSVKIPNSVTSIGYYAFYNCIGLTNITLSDSMTHINNGAFGRCTALEGIKIPDSVTRIGVSAFEGCSGLTSITIPESVTSIGSYIFENCKNLKDITFRGTIEQWREAEKAAKMGLGVSEGTKIVCKDGEIIK